jgi:hypothetical protein
MWELVSLPLFRGRVREGVIKFLLNVYLITPIPTFPLKGGRR